MSKPGLRARGRSLLAFMAKELHHIVRDRQTLTVLMLMPLVQVVLFGFAIRTDVRGIRVAIIDPSPDDASKSLRARFDASRRFQVVGTLMNERALDTAFRRGEADVGLVIEPDFGGHLSGTTPARVQLVLDAIDPNTSDAMRAYALAVIGDFQRDLRRAPRGDRLDRGGLVLGRTPPAQIRTDVRMRFNPTLESVNLFVPGLIALVLTIVSALMTSVSLSREKETGTLEVLLVSPLRPWQVVVGKVLPYLALAFANALTALLAAWIIFRVPLRGSLVLLLAECLLYTGASLSLGAFIGVRSPSQRAAMLTALVGSLVPNFLLSGMIFPIASLPTPLRLATYAVPTRWFISIVRGIMLKGVGLDHLLVETGVLAAMTLVLVTAAIRSAPERLA